MKNEIATKMSPEGLEIANAYLEYGNIQETATALAVDENTISEWLGKREVKAYIDSVYLDTGYRNRFKIGNILDEVIEQKLKELLAEQAFINGVIASQKYMNVAKAIKFMIYSFITLITLLLFEFILM